MCSEHKKDKFFLIIGPNGVGKSRFLEQYYKSVKNSDDGKILFVQSNKNFNPVNRQLSNLDGSGVFYRPNKATIEQIFKAAKDEVCEKKFDKSLKGVEKSVKKQIVDTYINCNDFSNKKDEIFQSIKEILKSTVKEDVEPTDYFWNMCCGYSKRFDQYKSEAKNPNNYSKVEKFYENQTHKQVSLADMWVKNRELLYKIMLDYAFDSCGVQMFAEEINAMLHEIGYKYNLTVKHENNGLDSSLSFTLRQYHNNNQHNDTIKLENIQLSSGERWILGVLMWQFTLLDSTKRIPIKCKEIILDEPDRHLDPKLCRQFFDVLMKIFIAKDIKVVMTTHKVDTVAIAPKDRIFKLPPDYNYNTKYNSSEEQLNSLQSSCKLEVIFRMTSNLREHHKVFTEALDDAYFYGSVYSFLRVYCSKVRQDARKDVLKSDDRLYWNINGEKLRILSERCPLSFYPASTTGNDQGGSEEVKKAVRRGQNFDRTTKGPFDELIILKPYGILDNDFNKKHDFLGRGEVKIDITDYIVILKRHSFENFLYDPFIIVSIANYKCSHQSRDISNSIDTCYQDLNAFIKNPVAQEKIQYAADQCFIQLINKTEAVDKKSILDNIEKEIGKSTKLKSDKETAISIAQKILDEIFISDDPNEFDRNAFIEMQIKDTAIFIAKKIQDEIFINEDPNVFNRNASIEMQIKETAKSIAKKIQDEIFIKGNPNVFIQNAFNKMQINETAIPIAKKIKMQIKNNVNLDKYDALFDIIKPEHIVNRRIVEGRKENWLKKLGTQKIVVIKDKDQTIEVEYPKLFLQWRGHELNSPSKLNVNQKSFKDNLIKNLQEMCTNSEGMKDPLYIPMDLAKLFFDLSTKVREHIREIIGKKKREFIGEME